MRRGQSRVQAHVERGRQLVRVARAENDTLKLSCLGEKMRLNERVLAVTQDGVASLRTAVHNNNRGMQVAQIERVAATSELCEDPATCGNAVTTTTVRSGVQVIRPKIIDDPTEGCDVLGLASCPADVTSSNTASGAFDTTIEYVAFASPFTPN